MDFSSLFDKVMAAGAEARLPKIFEVPGEDSGTYHMYTPEAGVETKTKVPKARAHRLRSLQSLVDLANRIAGGDSIIWFSREAVVLLWDDEHRADRAVFQLGLSPQLTALAEMDGRPKAFSQRELIHFLRVRMDGCAGHASADLMRAARAVKFRSKAEAESRLEKGSASIGKALQQEMVGGEHLPDFIHLEVPVFSSPDVAAVAVVKLAVDIDLEEQRFLLELCPSEMTRAVKLGEEYLAHFISSNVGPNTPIHHGSP